ncbi:MAG: HRDC domain-containing protein [Deltaproteobacteria bacterium]|nr:HRDC domain-containing protein [Deltaproteobacteria bacterium]
MNTPESEGYVYVRERAAMESLIQRIGTAECVALDTEADSLHNYFEKVCLIQLSLGDEHYLVDPLCDLDLSGFLEALAGKPLILHGGDYDLRMLRASMGFRPRREVFDTMIAAQLLGIEQIGLAALVERFFGVTIGKEGQKSDWSRRPLSEKQLRYAVNDTRFLEQLAELMGGELGERGRLHWHKESCQAMVESTGRDRSRDPEEAWRIKGAGRLTRRQLAYLRELWHWRDEHARRANVPSFKIFGNQQILDLLQWAESRPGMPLDQGPKLPRNIRRSLLRTLEETITRVAAMDEAQWPELRRVERDDAPRADFTEQLNALRGECARIVKELDIAASTLAPRAALEAIAQSRPRTVNEIMATGGLLRWQADLVQGAVEKCLHSPGNRKIPAK